MALSNAKKAKQDEFYTQYVDIQKEVETYLEFDPDTFRDKVVYCNCDDPFESNFFKYFATNFNKLGLKKLVTTSYDGSPIAGTQLTFDEYNEGNGKRQKPKALAVTLDRVKDEDGDGAANVTDVELFLKRNKAARIAVTRVRKLAVPRTLMNEPAPPEEPMPSPPPSDRCSNTTPIRPMAKKT